MITHLKDRKYYEDIYDRVTVEFGRLNQRMFDEMYENFFKIMPDEPKDSFRSVFHLNLIYVVFVGNDLLRRYDDREADIEETMARDRALDERLAKAKLKTEPVCEHCGKTGLRITDKMLTNRKPADKREDVLFMLKCTHCQKNNNYWEDGTVWEKRLTYCPKCHAVMKEKTAINKKILTTTYACSSCKHSYKEVFNLRVKKEKPDPNFEADRTIYCLHDEKHLKKLRDASWRYKEMARLGKEMQERVDNQRIYDAIKELKKPKIAELKNLLEPKLKKAGYMEFDLEKPEVGNIVYVRFSCLDGKSDREDYTSRKTLQTTLRKALSDTNWRLTSDGISYRLGYLSGRFRAYEQEEDLKKLVAKNGIKIKPKRHTKEETEKNEHRIKSTNGEDIIL